MLDRIVTGSRLLKLVDELALSRPIVGPVRRNAHYFYKRVNRASALDLGFSYCVYSPKAFLFPSHETLFTFECHERAFTTKAVHDDGPVAIVGVHPCDVNAIRLLDHVFANGNRDEHYLRRRRRTFIVAIDCPKPCTAGVFCRDMKANEAAAGFDVMLCPLTHDDASGEVRYGVVFGTDAGREWVLYAQAGEPPTVADERAAERYLVGKREAFPRMIPYDADTLPELLDRSYDSLLWEATARRCYSCGSCNLSCPTCYCFNTYDEVDLTLKRGERRREWDGCHLPGFAVVAGGHNFRSKAAARLRHRIFRKAKWIKEREGIAGCVGCARCDRACTAKINSVEIYNQLAEER
jgi:ferredoxin